MGGVQGSLHALTVRERSGPGLIAETGARASPTAMFRSRFVSGARLRSLFPQIVVGAAVSILGPFVAYFFADSLPDDVWPVAAVCAVLAGPIVGGIVHAIQTQRFERIGAQAARY